MTDRYASYTRLRFDRPHPRVLRIVMGEGHERPNPVDAVMHRELGEVWRDVDADPETNAVIITGAGLLCDALSGAEAERIGLISLAVEDAELDTKALEIAVRLAEGAQSAIRWTKHSLNNWLRAMGPTFDASLALEFFGFGGPDVKEGIASHLEKRRPNFPEPPSI